MNRVPQPPRARAVRLMTNLALACGILSLATAILPIVIMAISPHTYSWFASLFRQFSKNPLTELIPPTLIFGPSLTAILLSGTAERVMRGVEDQPCGRIRPSTTMDLALVGVIFTLLALITGPYFVRSHHHPPVTRVLNELRQVDAAKDQYALETAKGFNSEITPSWSDLTPYLKAGSSLAKRGGRDNVGNPILIGSLRDQVRADPKTKEQFQKEFPDAPGDAYWGPYS